MDTEGAVKDKVRIKALEDALKSIIQMNDRDSPLPLSDKDGWNYARRVIRHMHQEARRALKGR